MSQNKILTPNPRFTGLFIPVEILNMEELTSTDQMLLAWIDALYSEEHGGCFASNEYFAQKLHLKENTIKILITKLVDLGLVERVSFNGRQRILKTCKENWFKNKSIESTSEVDSDQPQTLIKINPRGSLESTPHNIYIKEEIKDKTPPNPQRGKAPPAPSVCISFGSHVKLKKEEHEKLKKDHGEQALEMIIQQMNDYCQMHGKKYKDYAAALRQWFTRRKENPQKSNPYKIEKRTKNMDGTIAENPYEGRF